MTEHASSVREFENPETDRGEPRSATASATGLRTMVIVNRRNVVPDEELRRRVATDAIPDAVSIDDAIGATLIDDRYFASMPGMRGRLLRRMPPMIAQLTEILLRGSHYDAVLTWSDLPAIAVAGIMRTWRRRPAHVAILMWPAKRKKAIPLRIVQRGIDRIIVCAPRQRQFVEEELGVPVGRLVKVRFGADTRFWRPMPGAGDMICSVGQEMRDYGTLLEALRPLDISCHIAAASGMFNTTSDKWWRATVDQQPLPDRVTVGAKTFAELRALYARSRFVVVPLLPSDSDNGITSILEAFAMGKAVICTDTAGQIGVLEHGVNCLRVPPFDVEALRAAIVKLWGDPEMCRRLGAAGRQLVEARHSNEQWIAGVSRGIEEAVAVRAAAGRARGRAA